MLLTRILAGILTLMVLAACTSPYPAPVDDIAGAPRFLDSGRVHRVNGGETLYAIAWMYDLEFGALARANNLREPYEISPGQMLSVDLRSQPASVAQAAAAVPQPRVATATPVLIATPVERTTLPSGAPLTRQSLPENPPPADRSTLPAQGNEPPASLPDRATAAGTDPAVASPPVAVINPPPVVAPPLNTPATPVVPVPQTNDAPVAVAPPAPAAEPAPAAAANGAIAWQWPARGNLIGRFSDNNSAENKGIDLSGSRGDPVLAAADGEVVYAGSGLLRYGDLVILKHSERFLSAYAHNNTILVKEGERVRGGQQIAELGSSGIDREMLHFEIRLDGKPVDPMTYLPARP